MNIKKIEESNTKIIGKKIEYFKEINSTHKYAKNIAIKQENNGMIIIAEKQTEGIGTKGRTWYTGIDKNIAMTIILKPQCQINKLEGLTLKIAEAMKETLNELYQCNVEIKIPNDLMLNNKKICGILTEINTIGEKINYLLISLGLNVNEEEFTEDTKEIATSLKKEYNKDFEREAIISRFLEKIEKIELI